MELTNAQDAQRDKSLSAITRSIVLTFRPKGKATVALPFDFKGRAHFLSELVPVDFPIPGDPVPEFALFPKWKQPALL